MINKLKVEFNDKEMEQSFRGNSIRKDSSQGIFAFVISMLPLLFFAVSDFLLFGAGEKFYYLAAVRGAMLLVIAGMIVLLSRSKNYLINDVSVFLFCVTAISGILYIYSTRPYGYSPYAVYDIIMILSIYLLFPNRFMLQLIPGIIYTVLNFIFLIKSGAGADVVLVLRIGLSLFFANILGVFLSWRIHYLNRMEYAALKKEKELSRELDAALKNVKTLSGLLPICSKCHKIRNDEGYWKSIDRYIEEHSDAQFTHSLCNECIDNLYGNEEWYKNPKAKKQSPGT